ncbi:MAG: hypothetical protein LBE56_00210 [Tannerella sp.]|jgi:hypothetical protein|nr:hypothetical protein [Tannerella sp.]
MNEIESYKDKVKPGRETRLYNEWKMLDAACAESSEIDYAVTKRTPSGIPIAYEITFRITSITGVEDADAQGFQKPVFGDRHILQITLPNNYPSADGGYPDFKFVTDVWHPNIRFFGAFKGHVCLSFENSSASTSLAEFVGRVAAYLRYEDYHAIDEAPFPEDPTVAEWARKQWTMDN